jgi:ATP-dependent Lon protease
VSGYTREAGVRNLEREVGAVLRNVAARFAEGQTTPVRITPEDLPAILGPGRFEREVAGRAASGKLILTGQLGDVMKESAQAALSLLRSRASALSIEPGLFERSDIHVH